MAEVVSVSEPSPLEVFKPGLKELVFSEAEGGWSGTGIAPETTEDKVRPATHHRKQTQLRGIQWGNERHKLSQQVWYNSITRKNEVKQNVTLSRHQPSLR